MMKKTISLMSSILTAVLIFSFISICAQSVIITQWNFDDETLNPNTGSGTATNIGGTSFTWATGFGGAPSIGWNTSTYPEQSANSGTAGVEFFVSTEGFQNIELSFYHRSSGTASRWSEIHYTLDGISWQVLGNNTGGLSPHDTFYPFEFSFENITGANDNPAFGIRIVSVFSPVAFEDGLGNSYGPNEAYHRARVSGGNVYAPGGTWRFDDVTISGDPITVGGAVKLGILDLNGGNSPVLNTPFSLTVQSLNGIGFPVVVTTDTEVTLTLTAGNGVLSGNLVLTIPQGEGTIVFNDLVYNVAEEGVVITASATAGMPLEPASTESFEVLGSQAQVITKWTFDDTIVPEIGEGVASLIGGVTQHSATIGSGWRITTFPEQYQASGTAGAQFMVSTQGFQDIVLDFGHRASGTASRWAEIQFTTDGGNNWLALANNDGDLTPHDVVYPFSFDFSSVTAANNNSLFGVRIVSIFSPVAFNPEVPDSTFAANTAYHRARTPGTGGNEYSGDGNWRLLEVTFSGETFSNIIPGDANCDGIVNILDAITMVNYVINPNTQPFCFENADVNGDGVVNILDVVGVINLILSGGK